MSDPIGNTAPSVASAPSPNIIGVSNESITVDNNIGESPIENLMDTMFEEPKIRKKRSKVWLDFEEKKFGDGTIRAICNHCKKSFDGSSAKGTTHLANHAKICVRKSHKDVGQQLLCMSKSTGDSSKGLSNWKFDPNRTRMDFARMIARHNLPFIMTEYEYFRVYMRNCVPMIRFYSRNTIRADVLKIYNELKFELQEVFDQLTSKVSLTTDLWSPEYQDLGYSCVTCHFIDSDWNLIKKIIAYQMVPAPHTGEALSGVIKSVALAWNIDKKLFAVTVDNASSNDVMARDLREWLCSKGVLPLNGDLFHVRCSAHILNLIVQDGLKVIDGLLEKIRDSVKYTKSSQARSQKFKSALAQTRLANKGVSWDIPTRWNSTYLMLESAIEVRAAFERLAELAPDYKHLPSSEEWEVGIVICECLKIFYDVTLHFSGVKYPTANLYFKGVCDVYHSILQWINSEHDYVHSMAYRMKEKFDKYWSTCNLFMSIGVVFDPCYKMAFIEYAFEMIYGDDAGFYIKQVQIALKELYSKYALDADCIMDQASNSCGGGLDSFGGGSSYGSSKIQEGFKRFIKERSGNAQQVPKTELDKYLEEDLFPLDENEKSCDILYWWKNNGPKFPILARIARDILAVPVSTVASESAFSIGGQIITESRSSLAMDVVEALVCTRDWLPPINDGVEFIDDE